MVDASDTYVNCLRTRPSKALTHNVGADGNARRMRGVEILSALFRTEILQQ